MVAKGLERGLKELEIGRRNYPDDSIEWLEYSEESCKLEKTYYHSDSSDIPPVKADVKTSQFVIL